MLISNCCYDSMPFWAPLIECLFVQLDTIWGAYGKVFKQGLLKNFLHNVNLSVGTSFLLHSSKLKKWNSRNME
jgi:hypothetical protein